MADSGNRAYYEEANASSKLRNTIVLSGDPKGHFVEGELTSGVQVYPGQFVCKQSDGTYNLWSHSTGVAGSPILVTEDWAQGKTVLDEYAAGAHFFGYSPVPGDIVQGLFKNLSGTADAYLQGSQAIIETLTGKLIATTGTPAIVFDVIEDVNGGSALTADTLGVVRMGS